MASFLNIAKTVGIMAVSAAVVAIGARQVYRDQRLKERSMGGMEREQHYLIDNLRGDDVRARLSPGKIGRFSARASSRSEESRAEELTPRYGQDRMQEEDRSALDRFIDRLSGKSRR